MMPSDDCTGTGTSIPAKPSGGWGTLSAWIEELKLEWYCVTFVRGVNEREALRRLGAPPESIRRMTYEQAGALSVDSDHRASATAVAVRIGEWVVLVEQNSAEGAGVGVLSGAKTLASLSAGTEMVSAYYNVSGWGVFVSARDGVTLARFDQDDGPEPQYLDGEAPQTLSPYVQRIGLDRFTYQDEDEGYSSHPTLELACLIAGIRPRPEDFEGYLLGAYWW